MGKICADGLGEAKQYITEENAGNAEHLNRAPAMPVGEATHQGSADQRYRRVGGDDQTNQDRRGTKGSA